MAPHHPHPRPLVLDTAACAAIFERARATDLLILCFGVALGILFYALANDLVQRWSEAARPRRHARPAPTHARTLRAVADSELLAPPPYAPDSKV